MNLMPSQMPQSTPSTTQSFINTIMRKAARLFGRSPGLTDATAISPTALLENFIPGYGPIHKFLLVKFGIDVTVIVSLGAVLWLADRITHILRGKIDLWVEKYWTSEICVSSNDEIYYHLEQFLVSLPDIQASRQLEARTKTKSTWEADSEIIEESGASVEEGEIKYLKFSEQVAKSQPDFLPGPGRHKFSYDGAPYILDNKGDTSSDNTRSRPRFGEKKIKIICHTRSTESLKKLLSAAKEYYYRLRLTETIIMAPAHDQYMGQNQWRKVAEQPHRSESTLQLDKGVLNELFADINKYLQPTTRVWYGKRGIPYRRGYLLYGPPGNGKSSLVQVIAAKFMLDIYVVNLGGSTEEELAALFAALPVHCIVLLEDIDTAGLTRDNLTRDNRKSDGTEQIHESEDKSKISMSGLLNIIDGVGSRQGRVLIMTTNRKKSLDDALIRPGRVDHQVAFHNATRDQARDLFHSMYVEDNARLTDELKSLAEKFSKPIDDGQFSMAELQGYLLKYKEDPRKACDEIENGIKDMLKVKGAGKK